MLGCRGARLPDCQSSAARRWPWGSRWGAEASPGRFQGTVPLARCRVWNPAGVGVGRGSASCRRGEVSEPRRELPNQGAGARRPPARLALRAGCARVCLQTHKCALTSSYTIQPLDRKPVWALSVAAALFPKGRSRAASSGRECEGRSPRQGPMKGGGAALKRTLPRLNESQHEDRRCCAHEDPLHPAARRRFVRDLHRPGAVGRCPASHPVATCQNGFQPDARRGRTLRPSVVAGCLSAGPLAFPHRPGGSRDGTGQQGSRNHDQTTHHRSHRARLTPRRVVTRMGQCRRKRPTDRRFHQPACGACETGNYTGPDGHPRHPRVGPLPCGRCTQ